MNTRIDAFLAEDLGPHDCDISVASIGPAAARQAIGRVMAKGTGVIFGLELIESVVRAVETRRRSSGTPGEIAAVKLLVRDGEPVKPGDVVAEVTGPVGTLLTSERTLLNLVQRLSGVATLTRAFVDAMRGTRCRLLDTRKTTPGLRDLEKAAVRAGGGVNHRFGLFDMVMLKDNHITAMGGDIRAAVAAARGRVGPAVKIEVEVATFEQLEMALDAGADIIMLDNMSPDRMKRCVDRVAGRVPLEASGGITLDTIAAAAATGVDYVSVGAVTHSARALDISMKITLC
ncbi:MAG TPA: carboxylating nicotinate-nucleotide diphosphorylase [Candidatus Ozemobacteraceae bacterium]|nr:carboxylating nicotinate-nucleotide diphosphorylase [Candidatus Ozemobacteraceae bacterium]